MAVLTYVYSKEPESLRQKEAEFWSCTTRRGCSEKQYKNISTVPTIDIQTSSIYSLDILAMDNVAFNGLFLMTKVRTQKLKKNVVRFKQDKTQSII